ncbi:MAG: N-acetylmuramoyl-L-alanine amidase, partial [Alphaproteobacteria bacterium]
PALSADQPSPDQPTADQPSAGSPAAATPAVTEARIGEHPDKTRFVLDLTQPVSYRIFMLADPYRVVIDLPEVDWTVPQGQADSGRGLIKGYRVGLFAPGTWRIVLDAAGPVRVKKAFLLDPREGHQYRFVLDLESVTREAFLAELKSAPKAAEPAPRLAEPAREAPPPAPKLPQKKIIALDPGHGGVDPGARSRSGVYEKDLTLDMAKELKRQLEATGRYHVVLTRDRDIFLRLRERIAIARAAGAELFISLHADIIADEKIRGLSVYTLSENASDEEAELLASKENKADIIAGIDLSSESPEVTNILIDLAQRETMNHSANLAEFAVGELSREVKLLGRSHRFAGFAVLKAPDVPSVLVELGYLSNRDEERLLRNPAYRARLSAALVRGIDRYFSWAQTLTKS